MDNSDLERGAAWLEQVLLLAGFKSSVSAELKEDVFASKHDDEESSEQDALACYLTIDKTDLTDADIQTLTGKRGEVLDALQYLASTTLNIKAEENAESTQRVYAVDLDGYRDRRAAALQEMADQAVEKVRSTGEEMELSSLSSAERRQIHTLLKDLDDLETFSRGREPERHLVVRLRH